MDDQPDGGPAVVRGDAALAGLTFDPSSRFDPLGDCFRPGVYDAHDALTERLSGVSDDALRVARQAVSHGARIDFRDAAPDLTIRWDSDDTGTTIDVEVLAASLPVESTTAIEQAGTYGDRTLLTPIDDAAVQQVEDYRNRLKLDGRTRTLQGDGPEYVFQRRVCGDTEYRISPEGLLPRAAWADGINGELGLAQDAKFVRSDARSWFKPDSLPPKIRALAERQLDDRLAKYREALEDTDSPLRGLEIVVNDDSAAQHIAQRMTQLGVPGVVRVVIDEER